jgi:hypothetical protein
MMSARRMTLPALAAVLALSVPGTALARGGGGGGGGGGGTGGGGGGVVTPTPTPDPAPTFTCDFSADGVQLDGSSIFTNQVGTAGCLTVRAAAGTVFFYSATVNTGWTYTINSGGGTKGRVDVTFTNSATRQTIKALVEPGKTKIG